MPSENNTQKLFAGAVALCLIAAAIVGIDYSQVRDRAGEVPTLSHRQDTTEKAIESLLEDAKIERRQFTQALADLNQSIQSLNSELAILRDREQRNRQ